MQSSELNLQIWKANSEIYQERQTKIISRGSKLTQESKGNARDRKVRVMLERQESSGHKKRRVRDKGGSPPLKFQFAATRVLEPTAGNLEAVRDPDS